jgi:TRAP-type C4-dicarboxylate transport system permease small subunit
MTGALTRLLQAVDDGLPALMVALVIVIMGSDIVLRDLFGTTIPGGVELSTFLFVWIVFLGGANASRTGSHFSVDLTKRFLDDRGHRMVALFVQVICIAVSATMALSSWTYMMRAWRRLAEGLQIPLGFLYIVLPLSFGLMAFSHVVRLFALATGRHPVSIAADEESLP